MSLHWCPIVAAIIGLGCRGDWCCPWFLWPAVVVLVIVVVVHVGGSRHRHHPVCGGTAVCENLGNTQIFCERVVSCAPKRNHRVTPLHLATDYTKLSFDLESSYHSLPHHINRDLKECRLCLRDSGWELEDHLCLALGVSSRICYRWCKIKGRTQLCPSTSSPADKAHSSMPMHDLLYGLDGDMLGFYCSASHPGCSRLHLVELNGNESTPIKITPRLID